MYFIFEFIKAFCLNSFSWNDVIFDIIFSLYSDFLGGDEFMLCKGFSILYMTESCLMKADHVLLFSHECSKRYFTIFYIFVSGFAHTV